MKLQEIVILSAKSRHGKNRISQHGSRWLVTQISDSVFCLDGAPGAMLRSIDCSCRTCEKFGQDGRWVRLTNDKNFEISGGETIGS